MNLKTSTIAGLVAVCSALTCFAQAERQSAKEPSSEPHELVARVKASTAATLNSENFEVFLNVLIPAGRTVTLDSGLDYTSGSGAAVTVQCLTCTTQAAALSTGGLTLQARWTMPNAASFVATENKAATAFPYWDSGGAVFSAYGPQFSLTLQNKGSQSIALAQVTIFRRK